MGMFDYYLPNNIPECPVCNIPLRGWQGKDGHNGLFVWQQGNTAPIEQEIDEECKISQEARSIKRLPEKFTIYSFDCGKHRVIAEGNAINGKWITTKLLSVENSNISR
ncbi:MAG: hypothetical protein NVSMB56_03890 [Pyrinomonadaceae bacterium]